MAINETVGAWLSDMRVAHRLTTEQIADAAQKYGCNWHGSTISSMERGGSRVSELGNLIVLLAALGDITGERLALADVFSGVQDIELGNGYVIAATVIGGILNGASVDLDAPISEVGKSLVGMFRESVVAQYLTAERLAGIDGTLDALRAYLSLMPTSAERRMATRLDVIPFDVMAACRIMYDAPLEAVADAEAGEGASPQKRGRATRRIELEVKARLRDMKAYVDESPHKTKIDAALEQLGEQYGR